MMEYIDFTREDANRGCYWQYSYKQLNYDKLNEDLQTEVVVVGEGLAAVSVAYNLIRSGKQVVLISGKPIGTSGAGKTNSHLLTALDNRYFNIEKIFGEANTRLIAESHKKAIDHIERTVAELQIDCEFERVDGFLFLHTSGDKRALVNELKSARNAGLSVTDLPFVLGTNKHIPCLKFYDQAQFHPVKYLEGLCEVISRAGGKIYTNCGVSKIDAKGVLTRAGHRVSAEHIVVASEEHKDDLLKSKTYRTYNLVGRIKRNSVRKFLWWDTGNRKEDRNHSPYHYVRVQKYDNEYDLLVCGGQTHAVSDVSADSAERYILLESWMRERFPVLDIIYKWSAEVNEPANHIGYIGKKPGHDNVWIISGDSGHGAMTGTIAGLIIPDLINKKANQWANLYDPSYSIPSRFSVAVNNMFRNAVSFLNRGAGFIYKYSPARNLASAITAEVQTRKDHKDELFTEGLHSDGNLYWSNDEESWDRINRKKDLSYNQK